MSEAMSKDCAMVSHNLEGLEDLEGREAKCVKRERENRRGRGSARERRVMRRKSS